MSPPTSFLAGEIPEGNRSGTAPWHQRLHLEAKEYICEVSFGFFCFVLFCFLSLFCFWKATPWFASLVLFTLQME